MKNMFLIINLMVFLGCNLIMAGESPLPAAAVTIDDVHMTTDSTVSPAEEDIDNLCGKCLALLFCPVATAVSAVATAAVYPCLECKIYLSKDLAIPEIPTCCTCKTNAITRKAIRWGTCLGECFCCPCLCCDCMRGCKADSYMNNLINSLNDAGRINQHRRKMQQQLAAEEAARGYQAPGEEEMK